MHGGRISVLEFGTGRLVGVTAGPGDANPGWSADGARIGFRRGLTTLTVPSAGGAPPQLHSLVLAPETTQIAWRPDLGGVASVVAGLLALPGAPRVVGAPAYAPDGSRLAFANAGGLSTIPAAGGDAVAVTTAPAEVAALGAGRLRARVSRRAASCARSRSAPGRGRCTRRAA